MEKHQFKPFERVLVRDDDNSNWNINFYSYYRNDLGKHQCASWAWKQCIPYNEKTAHLIGTNRSHQEPEPKVWLVTSTSNNGYTLLHEKYSDNELKEFIESEMIKVKKYSNLKINHLQ